MDLRELRHILWQLTSDVRLRPTHISLYTTLCANWLNHQFANPFNISREEIMVASKIRSNATYRKCIQELNDWGYIRYNLSFHPTEGSAVFIKKFKSLSSFIKPESVNTNFKTMPASVVTPEDLQVFKQELLEELNKLLTQTNNPPTQRWLKSHQVRRMLLVSPGTLQNLRINGTLPFTKIGGVIFYDSEDIKKMLDKHKQNTGILSRR